MLWQCSGGELAMSRRAASFPRIVRCEPRIKDHESRVLCCWMCRVELEEIPLADGRAAVICVGCDLIGVADEVALAVN